MEAIESKLAASADGVVPVRDQIFEFLRDVQPKNVKIIAIGPGPVPSSASASGYALLDGSAQKWSEKLPVATQRLFDALKSHAQNEGNAEFSSAAGWSNMLVKEWFEHTKRQGVLWLNSCLTRSITTARTSGDEARERSYWLPVILRVIRYLMEVKASDSSRTGLVFALFGAEGSPRYDDVTSAISKYYMRFSSTLSIRTYKAPDPTETAFKNDEDSNPLAEINAALMETNNDVLQWFPTKVKSQPAVSSKPVASVPPPKPVPAANFVDDEADEAPLKPTLQKKRTAAEMSKPAPAAIQSDGAQALKAIQPQRLTLFCSLAFIDWESALGPKPKKAKTMVDDEDDDWKPSSLREPPGGASSSGPKKTAVAGKPTMSKKKKSSVLDDEYDSTDSFIAPEDDFGDDLGSEDDGDGGGSARPVCRYGESCYRKNPDHFKEFRHPWLDK